MRASFAEAVLEATDRVFNNVLTLETEREESELNSNFVVTEKANVSVGFTGGVRGTVLFSFPEEMVLEIVSDMSGMKVEELDAFATSAVGELANIICGQALNAFCDDNRCDISPPQTILGEDKTVAVAIDEILTVPVKTEMGRFEVNIALGEG